MKKFSLILILTVVLFTGCTPIVRIATDNENIGYSTVIVVNDNVFTTARQMRDFVDVLKTKDDVIIKLSSFRYIILRK